MRERERRTVYNLVSGFGTEFVLVVLDQAVGVEGIGDGAVEVKVNS